MRQFPAMLQNYTTLYSGRIEHMDRIFCRTFSFFDCKLKPTILAFAWVGGLLLGAVVSVSADNLLASTMRAALSGSMSIMGPVAVVLLPLFLSAYAVYFSQPIMLAAVVFLKAFLFAYAGAALLILYPVSGWLLRWLLMFSDMVTMPILWFLWISVSFDNRESLHRRIVICAFCSVLVGCVDLFMIVPFLARLI
jgi:hypothetical protein